MEAIVFHLRVRYFFPTGMSDGVVVTGAVIYLSVGWFFHWYWFHGAVGSISFS